MLSAWSQHLSKDPEAKQKFEDMVKGSKLLTDRLQNILDAREAGLEHQELSERAFDNPNWAIKQAYLMGRKSELRTMKFILDTNPIKEQ